MRTLPKILALLATAGVIGTASAAPRAQSMPSVDVRLQDNTLSGAMLRNSRFVLGSDEIREYRLENYFLERNIPFPPHSFLTQTPDRMYGLQRYELTPFQTALEGAGMAATVGLFAGALANTFGVWNEDTSWYVAGAMGALGAILGGTYGASDPGFRVRFRWEPDDGSLPR